MKFIATKRGFFEDRIIEAGESFEAVGFTGSWAVESKQHKPKAEKTENQKISEAKEGLQGKKKKTRKKKA